jgi:hypothetical protein
VCEPISIISGVLGAASSVAGHVSQQNAASAANAGRIANYKHQLKIRENNWMRLRSQYKMIRSTMKRLLLITPLLHKRVMQEHNVNSMNSSKQLHSLNRET